jgi:tripartite-type tricarboxylate transporter receptor subunit TctC
MIKTLFGAALCAAASLAHAAWPERPVKLVVPYAAGGAADALARVVATELGSRLKQQVIVENKAGAGGTIGAQSVAQAPADGYTFLYDATSFAVNPSLFPKLTFSYARDFTPVGLVARIPTLLRDALASSAVRQRLGELGALPATGGASELGEFVQAETAKWAGVIKASNIKAD